MFSVVMWATDGSAAADSALPLARYLVAESDGRLVVVHCDEHSGGGGRSAARRRGPGVVEKIEAQVAGLRRDGVDVALHIEPRPAGGAAEGITELATAAQADVIAVGTRGQSSRDETVLGSVTQRLLHASACPVLAVPAAAGAAGP